MKTSFVIVAALMGRITLGATITVSPQGSIQWAILNSEPGDVILVEPGTYVETLRIVEHELTIRSTGGPGATIIAGSQTRQIVWVQDSTVTLDGFTIVHSLPLTPENDWAKVEQIQSSFVMENCIILGSRLPGDKAASYQIGFSAFDGGFTTIRDCEFRGLGKAADFYSGNPYLVTDCLFQDNHGFYGTVAAEDAGAIRRCTFRGNSSLSRAVVVALGPTVIDRCIFDGNRCESGAAALSGRDSLEITNSLFIRNRSEGLNPPGTIEVTESGSAIITNITVAGNVAEGATAGLALTSGSASIANSIIWANEAETDAGMIGPVDARFCNVQGGFDGTQITTVDPGFRYPPSGDYRLIPTSPVIDAGDNGAIPVLVVTDLDGGDRRLDLLQVTDTGVGMSPIVDLGAYETSPDCNGNGVDDLSEILAGIAPDENSNGVPDDCELDCDGNGVPDEVEILSGAAADCNANGFPDGCEPDCDGDGLPDVCEADQSDCDGNGILDSCEIDCDGNGITDACDILADQSRDLNGNGVLDACECAIAGGSDGEDCDGDGFSDFCELVILGTIVDLNENLVDDNCECLGDIAPVGAPDGVVNMGDLTRLLFLWGTSTPSLDFDQSGSVDFNDLNILLQRWLVPCS